MSTDWAKTHGLAGRDLLAITLPELIYMGWQNQGLRYLGQGWFTGVLTRNIRESVFVETMLKHVRAKGIDLDSATKAQAVQRGANGGDNLTNADKAHLMDEMAQFIMSPLQHNKDVACSVNWRKLTEPLLNSSKAKMRLASCTCCGASGCLSA